MATRRPLIGITCGMVSGSDPVKYGVNRSYVRAVDQAGGIPFLVPPQSSVDDLLEILDGILLTGGGDLEPAHYGTENRGSEDIDPDRDALELSLARRAAGGGPPILGICRGQQVINVAFGGGLLQDVGEHRQQEARSEVTHAVDVVPGSALAEVLGEKVDVNTLHHQVVDPERLGRGLRVSALSADGARFIEGLESADGRILAVQWHPEELTDREEARRLFRHLVERAAGTAPSLRRRSTS